MSDAANPWQVTCIPVERFPMEAPKRELFQKYFRELAEGFRAEGLENHEVFLQTWKLSPATGSNTLNREMPHWAPEPGLGVWPDRKPPASWTETSFVNAAAAMFGGSEPALTVHRLLRISAPEPARIDAAEQMRGSGTLVEVFSRRPAPVFFRQTREQALARITEANLRDEKFYLPLLDNSSVSHAGTPQRLTEWLAGADVFIRESAEDKGILVISKVPLAPLFERIAKRMQGATLPA